MNCIYSTIWFNPNDESPNAAGILRVNSDIGTGCLLIAKNQLVSVAAYTDFFRPFPPTLLHLQWSWGSTVAMLALERELWCAILNYALSNTSTVSSDLVFVPSACTIQISCATVYHCRINGGMVICAVFHLKLWDPSDTHSLWFQQAWFWNPTIANPFR